jgi:hypothetical protein
MQVRRRRFFQAKDRLCFINAGRIVILNSSNPEATPGLESRVAVAGEAVALFYLPAARAGETGDIDYSISLISLARAMAPVLVLTSNFANTFFKCHFAVDSAMRERSLIS